MLDFANFAKRTCAGVYHPLRCARSMTHPARRKRTKPKGEAREHVGAYVPKSVAEDFQRAANKYTNGNKSALLVLFLREGVEHLAKQKGTQ